MELWIRSQSKISLNKVNGVYYGAEGEFWAIYEKGGNFDYLGLYTTKERCLEIIDEIQELLKLGNPENAFYNITNCKMPPEELAELFKRVRKDKAIVTKDVEFEVFMPSVVTYEMPEE